MSSSLSFGPSTHLFRPSSARLITLDGFVPVPRGTPAAAPSPPSWPLKDPADVLDYALDFTATAAGDQGDAVADIGVVISPSVAGDLVLNSATADGSLVVLWLAAGQSGTVYSVVVTVKMESGRSLARAVLLPVYSLSSAIAGTGVLITEAGVQLTDAGGNPIAVGN